MSEELIKFLSRLTWDDVRKRSSTDDEAYKIMEEIQKEISK